MKIFNLRTLRFLATVSVALFFLVSCSSSRSNSKNNSVYKKRATASYYHDKFNGRFTASGEKFSNKKLTAAHKQLPFGSRIRVANLINSKSVELKVNDRGPFTRGRDLDLSKKAFMQITDHKDKGVLQVKIELLKN